MLFHLQTSVLTSQLITMNETALTFYPFDNLFSSIDIWKTYFSCDFVSCWFSCNIKTNIDWL